MRSPASRSPLDLIAFKIGIVLFIQCKRSGALPPSEWNALYDLAQSVGVKAVLSFIPPTTLKGVGYKLLTGRKLGLSSQKQPMELFEPGIKVQVIELPEEPKRSSIRREQDRRGEPRAWETEQGQSSEAKE